MGDIQKFHKFFIDFYFPFVYDIIAKYGMLYFVENRITTAFPKQYYERGYTHYGKA